MKQAEGLTVTNSETLCKWCRVHYDPDDQVVSKI